MKKVGASNSVIQMLLFVAAWITLYFALYTTGILTEAPGSFNLIQWDASWYQSIVDGGYVYRETEQSNAGFFPGFPTLWRMSGLGASGISVINALLFFSGVFILIKQVRASAFELLYLITLPSVFFFFAPYSEALFYIFGAGIIYAWNTKKVLWLLVFGIGASFVRPMFFFLIPAIVLAFLLKEGWKTKAKWRYISLLLCVLVGAGIGFGVIGMQTGDFFAYSKSQVEHWNHGFGIPSLPFTTWRGARILWLDAFALFFTLFSGVLLLKEVLSVVVKKKKTELDAIELISLGYISMILVYVLFFHPEEEGRTSLLSMNRYVFCSPFLHYLLVKRIRKSVPSFKNISVFLLLIVLTLLVIGFPFSSVVEWNHAPVFYYSFVALFLVVQSLVFFRFKFSIWLQIAVLLMNVLLQLYLFNSFLKGNWVG